MDLASALGAESGICCFVGAGGKKTTMYRLAHEVDRAVVTATVRIPIFDEHVATVVVTENPRDAIEAATDWPLGVVPEQEGDDRYRGYEPEQIDALADVSAEVLLVKADGARMRRFKAPGSHEPRIPTGTETVVPIVSVQVVGEPLDDRLVHRPGEVAALTDIEEGEQITPEIIADVVTSPEGGFKDAPPDASVIPLVNMVDTDELLGQARAIADAIHRRACVPHVVLASMRSETPIVDIVTRPSRF